MVRLIIFLGLFYLFIKLLKALLTPQKSGEKESEGEYMVKDPNCDTYIPIKDAVKGKIKGEKLFFCSDKCLKEYKEKG